MNHEKRNIIENIDLNRKVWESLALQIHEHPELSFDEYKAMNWLTAKLEKAGFDIQKNLTSQLPTSFIATKKGEGSGPRIGLIAEYDALPGLGHACGHNIIGTSSVGAAIELVNSLERIPGELVVIGTPAEEEGGGKVILTEEGWFNDFDAVMMCHPRDSTMILRGSLACVDIDIQYNGLSAHAAANPESGHNALDALIQHFIAIKQLLPALPSSTNINGIIVEGGEATNIIPDKCKASFLLRAETTQTLKEVKDRFYEAANSSCKIFEVDYEAHEGLTYAERINNHILARTFQENLESINVQVNNQVINTGIGSSDIGNVSYIAPTIHPYIKIGEATTHTKEFTKATASAQGMDGMTNAIKALALTTYDLMTTPSLVNKIKEEWLEEVKHKQRRTSNEK